MRLERDAVPAKVKFHEVRLPNPTPRWPIEVVSPQGWIVRLQNSSELQTLPQLLRAMELVRGRTLPQGLLGQAIDYALKRWDELTRFVDDGTLEIDNNLIENAIRPSAIGTRNWLFIGHPEAGERSAVIYTLLGSCRRHGINPFEYLKDLFTRLPSAKITEIKQFTPAAWAKEKAKKIGRSGSLTSFRFLERINSWKHSICLVQA